MFFERFAGGLVVFEAGFGLQFREEIEDFVPLAVADPLQGIVTWLEAFRPCSV